MGTRLTDVLHNASVYPDAERVVVAMFAGARDVTNPMQANREIIEQQAAVPQRLARLERFQQLTIGHELRIDELRRRSRPCENATRQRGANVVNGTDT